MADTPRDKEDERLNPWTERLIDDFAVALKEKMLIAQNKYHYDDSWRFDDWRHECLDKMLHHIEKGDPRDVAAYCAFLWYHGWSTRLKAW
jgi:hypothetical protein